VATPTVRTIGTDALREIGAIGIGQEMPATEAELVLLRFQNQLDAWQADRLTINTPAVQIAYTIPSGTQNVTIGPGGTINTQRPVWITAINYVIPGTNPEVETPMGQMDAEAYAALTIKALPNQLTTLFYYEPSAPLGTLFFWPKVTQNLKIYLYLPQGQNVPATLDTVVQAPPGYAEAFMYQLAWRLVNIFGLPMPPNLPTLAAESYARIKRTNTMPGILGVDQALIPSFGGAYNVLSDNYTAPSNR